MSVGVVGLGYVGLPLAVAFAEAGVDVVGIDVDSDRVARLNAGSSPVEDISDERLAAVADRFSFSVDYDAVSSSEAVIICVPTPLSNKREPDLSYLLGAAEQLAAVLTAGQLIALESTTYPGTTREQLVPILERSGLEAGTDFNVAFSPERIDPGRTDFTVETTPKVVGGLTPACTDRAAALYEQVTTEVVRVGTPEVAELTKLLENIFRSVNIALVNELAQLCDRMSIDVWEVVDAAATKPFGFMRFEPGPGMGGHCLPVDPFYLSFKAREHDFYTEFIELAGKTNQAQPAWCAQKVGEALNTVGMAVRGARVCVLGVSYKAGVGDMRESPALKIIEHLRAAGAEVSYFDPHVPRLESQGLTSLAQPPGDDDCDCACIVTAHADVDYEALVAGGTLVVDFRGVTRHLDAENVVLLGRGDRRP